MNTMFELFMLLSLNVDLKTVITDLRNPPIRTFVKFEKKISNVVNNGRLIETTIFIFLNLTAESSLATSNTFPYVFLCNLTKKNLEFSQ